MLCGSELYNNERQVRKGLVKQLQSKGVIFQAGTWLMEEILKNLVKKPTTYYRDIKIIDQCL